MHACFPYVSPTPSHFIIPALLAITRYLARHTMSVFRETVHYSARQYIARYSQDFAMCILMVTLPPLFPMTFLFSYGVNPYYARPVTSPFAFFSYSSRPHVLLVFSQGRISKNSGRRRRCHDMKGISHIPWRHPVSR